MAIRLSIYEHADEVPTLPGSNFFHSVELFHILEQTPQFTPFLLVAYEGDTPIAKLLCAVRQIFSCTDVYQKAVIHGHGEYFNLDLLHQKEDVAPLREDAIFSEMLSYLTTRVLDHVFFVEFRNLNDPLFAYRYFRENHYFPVRWLRVQNSIHQNPIDKWMSPRRRRHIQEGIENGADLGIIESHQELQEFFRMLKKFYSSKVVRYMPNIHFFYNLFTFNTDKQLGEIFTVRYHGKIIGGAVCFFSGDTAYLILAGGLRKSYPSLYPNVLAIWNAMLTSRKMGYSHFEFMNAGLPFKKFGYRDFILRFGGRQLGTRRWFRFRWEWLNKVMEKFYS